MARIYLDYNATTPLHPKALERLIEVSKHAFGNPSSPHREGQTARALLREARGTIANTLNASENEIVFTSSGTESINWVLQSLFSKNAPEKTHIVSCTTEHHATLNTLKALQTREANITLLPVNAQGTIDLNDLERAIRKDTALISIMLANNETGATHPIRAITEIAHRHGVPVHSDAVCALGKIPIDVRSLDIDYLSFSGHKFYGPKGIGGLYIKNGQPLTPLLFGGTQERGKRAGTESVAHALAMATALSETAKDLSNTTHRIASLRKRLLSGLERLVPSLRVVTPIESALPNTLNIIFPKLDAEAAVIALDLEGLAVSTGSACTSGATEPSHVLLAMGLSASEAKSALRFSLGRTTSEEEIEETLTKITSIFTRFIHLTTNQNSGHYSYN